MNIQNDLPELSNYSELSSKEQLTIHQMLISYVRSDHLYNIILTHNVEPYDLVKLVSISFENRDAAIWVHFETITAERLTEPYRVCRRPTFLRECSDEKTKIYP